MMEYYIAIKNNKIIENKCGNIHAKQYKVEGHNNQR